MRLDDPRYAPSSALEMHANTRAQDVLLLPELHEVADALPGYSASETIDFPVEFGLLELKILLTNMSEDLGTWEPMFTLSGPGGESITHLDPLAWKIASNSHYGQIDVMVPTPGDWTLTLEAPQSDPVKSVPESHLVTITAEHVGPRCRADVSTKWVSDDSRGTMIRARATWEGMGIIEDVTYEAKVVRPDGTTVVLPLETNAEGVGEGLFMDYAGLGGYDVQVTCNVGDAARFHAGDAGDPLDVEAWPRPPRFKRAARTDFFASFPYLVLSDESGDCDGDGYLDVEEGMVYDGDPVHYLSELPDSDDDGMPDVCDEDSDSDELPDAMEAKQDTDYDGTEDRLDLDSDDDGDMDGFDADPLVGDVHLRYAEGDFDGDGVRDVARGDWTQNSNGGVVNIEYGDGTVEVWDRNVAYIADSTYPGDFFGFSVAAGDLDGDGYDDIVVGVPGDDIGSIYNGGSIHVFYGSASGISTAGDQVLHQNTTGIAGGVESYDYFGDRVAVGDLDGDGFDDVIVGIPREAIGSSSDSGAVQVIYGSAGGISTVDDMWYQGKNNGAVNGSAESFDRFGDALAVGNFNGDSFEDLAIGVPAEHIGAVADAGLVYVMPGSASGATPTGDFVYAQSTSGAAGTHEAYDRLGERFWVHDRNDDGFDDLTAFVRGDGCGPGTHGYQVTYGGPSGLSLSGNVLECADAYQVWGW